MAVQRGNRPRTEVVDEAFVQTIREMDGTAPADLDAFLLRTDGQPSGLTGRRGLALFEAQVSSRMLDFTARALRARDEAFYTIGSSGHEGNVVLGDLLSLEDLCFLHYRSGALMVQRQLRAPGESPLWDVLLSFCASSEDPVSGGRHKVWGSRRLNVPPQTSTIASHLPKAVGAAFALDRAAHLNLNTGLDADAIVCCSFGDASLNHSTTQGAMNAAQWAAHQDLPVPLLLVCEDNGLGISVHTPSTWIERSVRGRPALHYVWADGRHLPDAWDATREAIRRCREGRIPVFLHLKTCRLFGHAGSDVETAYHSLDRIRAAEAEDPVLHTARLLIHQGVASPEQILALYEELRERVRALGDEAARRPRLESAADVMAPLASWSPEAVRMEATRQDYEEERARAFKGLLPEDGPRPRHLAFQLNQGLRDLMAKYPQAVVFGEDVARKGGVYHVTDGLERDFGGGRVFNTLLDEQTILGLAIGAGHVGQLPIPEIQFLAYVHNAGDQLRGEASTLQFFSRGEWRNPMLVRVASFGYQRGFGGHFHNDASIAALRDLPGVVLACPTRGDDAVGMLRTAMALCQVDGRVVIFLEPIALYMVKDLYEPGDGGWLTPYPSPDEAVDLGAGRIYGEEATDLTILTFGNGVPLSLRAARRLADEGVAARVVDLRWLAPLNHELIREQAQATGRVLVVDEGRRSGGLSEAIITSLVEGGLGGLPMERVVGEDSFIPLGHAWEHVLPAEDDIVERGRALVRGEGRG